MRPFSAWREKAPARFRAGAFGRNRLGPDQLTMRSRFTRSAMSWKTAVSSLAAVTE